MAAAVAAGPRFLKRYSTEHSIARLIRLPLDHDF
jgi:hypothetical protein